MIQAAPPTATAKVEAASVETTKPETKPKVKGQAIDLPEDFVAWDIETGPQPDAMLKKLCPLFEPPPYPGEFDPATIKCGNIGGPESTKGKAKIEAARVIHHGNCDQYGLAVALLEAEHFCKFRDRAALDATTGQVVAIGIAKPRGITILGVTDTVDEGALLRQWWITVEWCLKNRLPMIGFNIKHFDLPFLVRRSWILGVPIPSGVHVGRYWSDLFVDLMEAWQQGSRELVSLNTLCAAFGLPGKVEEVDGVEVSGKTFHQLWKSDREVAKRYLEGDVLLPAELARRMQVV